MGVENAFAAQLFRGLPRRYDSLAEILSFGQNGRWRRELVRHVAAGESPGSAGRAQGAFSVLDVATGTAGVAMAIAAATSADITGVDLSEEMLERGRERVDEAGLQSRIHLQAGRAEQLQFPDASFDAVSFTYLLRYVEDPAATLAELARVLRPGGMMASLDFYVPPNPVWRGLWWLYTRVKLPLAGFMLGGRAWWDVGRFLGPNISAHYRRWPLPRIVAEWQQAGMADVGYRVMSAGGGLVMWGRKSGA